MFVLISLFEPSKVLCNRRMGTCITQDCKACAPFIGALCCLLQLGIKIFKQSNFIHTQLTLPAQERHTLSLLPLLLLYLHLLPHLHNHPMFVLLSCPLPIIVVIIVVVAVVVIVVVIVVIIVVVVVVVIVCEKILRGYLYDGDLVFVILKRISIFEFPKRFLEISSRDLTSFLLQLI
jgi:hypothetical protein